MDLNCLNCLFEPDWNYESVTMLYNHTTRFGLCRFKEHVDVPPCYVEHTVCLVIPDDPSKEIQFATNLRGSLHYMTHCGGWRPSDEFIREGLAYAPKEGEENAGL